MSRRFTKDGSSHLTFPGGTALILDGATQLSFSTKIKVSSASTGSSLYNTIFSVPTTSSQTRGFYANVFSTTGTNCILRMGLREKGSGGTENAISESSSHAINFNEWGHVGGMVDIAAGTMALRSPDGFDRTQTGKIWSQTFFTPAQDSLETVRIGTHNVNSNHQFDGEISHLAIWYDHYLTETELDALAAGVDPRKIASANLAMYFRLDGVHAQEWDMISKKVGTITGTIDRGTSDYPMRRNYFRTPLPNAETTTTVPVTGVSATGAAGNTSITIIKTPAGQVGTGAVGNVSIRVDDTQIPTGVEATGAVGTVLPIINSNTNVAVTGVEGTGAVGTVTTTISSLEEQSGVQATGDVGTDETSPRVIIDKGIGATGSVGTVSIGSTVAVTGVEAFGEVGQITNTQAGVIFVNGVEATGAVGTVFIVISQAEDVTGVEAVGQVGDVVISIGTGADVNVSATGVEAVGSIGDVIASGVINIIDITVLVTGVETIGEVGDVVVIPETFIPALWAPARKKSSRGFAMKSYSRRSY